MPAHSKAAEQLDIAAARRGGCAFDPPADLDEYGAELWREAMAMHPGSFWKRPYLLFLRQWIDAVLACERLDAEIKAEGETIRGEKGGKYINPLIFVRDRERAERTRLARLLAITPDSSTHDSAGDKRSQLRSQQRAQGVASAMDESQGLIPGLETVQ